MKQLADYTDEEIIIEAEKRIMTEPFDSNTGIIVTVPHQKLIAPVTGFAKEGKSVSGNKGLLIFIPTTTPKTLFDLIKVVKKNDS